MMRWKKKKVTHLEGSSQVGTRLLFLWVLNFVCFLLGLCLGLCEAPSRIFVFNGCSADS